MKKSFVFGLVALLLFSSFALLPAPTARAETRTLVQANTQRGWSFPNETIEPLTSAPSTLTVTNSDPTNFTVSYTNEGMKIMDSADSVNDYITLTTPVGQTAISFHISIAGTGKIKMLIDDSGPNGFYISGMNTYVLRDVWGKVDYAQVTNSYTLMNNNKDVYFALIQTSDGYVHLYMNSQEILKFQGTLDTTKSLRIYIADQSDTAGPIYISDVHYTNVTLTNPEQYWHDELHSTIIPWGYDFTYNVQIHIDWQTYNESVALYEVFDKYGVKASQTIWLHPGPAGSATRQSEDINNAEWKNFLLSEEEKGHEVGVHAVENVNMNRTALLQELEEFKSIFGHYPDFWIDHGIVQQDLYKNGTNESSEYYIYDWIQQNIDWYWVGATQSYDAESNFTNSIYIGENINGVALNSVHTIGHGQFANIFYAGDINEASYGFALDKNVLMVHCYAYSYLYLQNGTGKYAIDEIPNIDSSIQYSAEIKDNPWALEQAGGTWHVWEPYENLLKTWHDNYSVWFATTTDIVNRYESMKNLQFNFSASYVNISNPTTHAVSGVTIYTTEEPDYALYNPSNGMYYYPTKSNVTNTWNFVIPKVSKLSELHLQKVQVSMPELRIGSNPVAMWGDGSKLYIYAQKDGIVHVEPNFEVTANTVVIDLTTDEHVDWEAGSVIFTAEAGHTYVIVDVVQQSVDQVYGIVPMMVGLVILTMVVGFVGKVLAQARRYVKA